MHVLELPDDILLGIFHYCSPCSPAEIAGFKQYLCLLHVCRGWRQLALSSVYKTCFIYCKGGRLFSNIDIAKSAGCLGCIKRMYWRVNVKGNSSRVMDTVIYFIGRYARQLKSVCRLVVDINSELQGYIVDKDLQAKLRALLPNVTAVVLNKPSGVAYSKSSLYEDICSCYSKQMQSLIYAPHDAPIVTPHFEQLKHASVSFSHMQAKKYFTIVPNHLVKLALINIKARYAWRWFSIDGPADIHFDSLKYLKVVYDDINDDDNFYFNDRASTSDDVTNQKLPQIFYCPHLVSLEIVDVQARCPFLDRAKLPERMELISISGLADFIASLSNNKDWPRLETFVLKSHGSLDEPDGLLPDINYIVNRIQASGSYMVKIHSPHVMWASDLNCANITHLRLEARVNFDQLGKIITKLPQLEELFINFVTADHVYNEAIVVNNGEAELPIAPFNSAIRVFGLGNFVGNIDEKSASMVINLVVKLPRLERVLAGAFYSELILNIVKNHSTMYPHLLNIYYTLRWPSIKVQQRYEKKYKNGVEFNSFNL